MVHNQFDCQPNNSITMLMVNNDASLYECFSGDFFDPSVDTKEMLSSLNSSVPLTGLTLEPVGQTMITTDLNGTYHGLENSEPSFNQHSNHQQQHHHPSHPQHHHHHSQQQQLSHQQQMSHHHNQYNHQQQLLSPNSCSNASPNQSPTSTVVRSSSTSSLSSLSPISSALSPSSTSTSNSQCSQSSGHEQQPQQPTNTPTTPTSPSSTTTTTKSPSTTTQLTNVSLPLIATSDNQHHHQHQHQPQQHQHPTHLNSTTNLSSSNSFNSSVNHPHHQPHLQSVNSNSNNCKYTDYMDGKFDGLMSTFWTMDISKNSPFLSELASDLESRYWESKPPEQWTSEDVWHWIFSWAGDRNIDVDDVQPLAYANMNGQQLCSMSKMDFITMNPKYGSHIYDTLNQLIHSFKTTLSTSSSPGEYNCFTNLPSFDLLRGTCLDLDGHGSSPSSSTGSESDRESTSSSMTTVNERQSTNHLLVTSVGEPIDDPASLVVSSIQGHTIINPVTGLPGGKTLPALVTAPLTVPVKKVGRRGRPPKKDAKSRNRQGKGNGKLWEFIRDLLLDPATNPSLIRWERREDGVFKFVQSDKVAKLWGQRKQNPRMTYEKLSRAMRYYYKSQVLLPVFGRRLVYKFGPNATGWRAHPIY